MKRDRAEYQRRWRAANADKVRSNQREYHAKNKHKRRQYYIKCVYGLTPEEYEAMFEAQGRRCAACPNTTPGAGRQWNVDHCHTTGKVRGILCHGCNLALGMVYDDPARLRSLADYIESKK